MLNIFSLITFIITFHIAQAADASDVSIFTAFVSDFKGHAQQYLQYLGTANNVPTGITSLARQVQTYKDDSYTTMLDNPSIDVTQLVSFATQLPWATRFDAAAGSSGGGSSSDEGDSSKSSITSSPSSSGRSTSTKTKESSKTKESTKTSTTSEGLGVTRAAPVGFFLGALAVALL